MLNATSFGAIDAGSKTGNTYRFPTFGWSTSATTIGTIVGRSMAPLSGTRRTSGFSAPEVIVSTSAVSPSTVPVAEIGAPSLSIEKSKLVRRSARDRVALVRAVARRGLPPIGRSATK